MAVDIAYARIGTTVKGAAAYLRVPVAIAWRHLVAVVKADMGIDLDTRIIQARGGAVSSAGTHIDGACVDVRVWGLTKAQRRRIVLLARECGFPASWDRAWPGNEHLHLGADIPGVWTRASYQVAAVKAGFNGLGSGGRGGRDDGPKPSAWRNTTTGPEWARQTLAASGVASPGVPSTGDKPAATTPQEDIMATKEELAQIVKAEVNAALIDYSEKQARFLDRTDPKAPARATSHFIVQGHAHAVAAARNTAALLARSGLDAGKVVAGVVAGISGEIREAVMDALGDVDRERAESVADAVLDGIAKRMEA